MIDPNKLYVIEVWSSYADQMIPEGLAHGKEAAWKIAEHFHNKLFRDDANPYMLLPERVDTGEQCGIWYGPHMLIEIVPAARSLMIDLGDTDEHPAG